MHVPLKIVWAPLDAAAGVHSFSHILTYCFLLRKNYKSKASTKEQKLTVS